MECPLAEGADAQLQVTTFEIDLHLPSHQGRNFSHRAIGHIGDGFAETYRQQAFGVCLDGIQVFCNLPHLVGQGVEAGDDGLLFSERGERNRCREKIFRSDGCVSCRPFCTGAQLRLQIIATQQPLHIAPMNL